MVPRKIKLRRIENGTIISQSLCDVALGGIISSIEGKLASPSFPGDKSGDLKAPLHNHNSSNIVETKRSTHARLSNEDLDRLSLRDLIQLEQQFHGYLGRVRAKKDELLLEQLGKEEVTEVSRATNGNSNTMDESVDSGENSGSHGDASFS